MLLAAWCLWLIACRAERPAPADSGQQPPVILISIDTLRADHLPAWGYTGVATPAIDSLRTDGVLYRNAWSHVPLTLPSHVSILTGLLPYQHGVRDNLGYRFDATSHPPVTAPLRKAGYETAAAVSAYVLRGSTGLASAFDSYNDAITVRTGEPTGNLQRSGMATLASSMPWISARRDKPFLFMLHIFEPHSPYTPPEPFRSRFANRYDGEVAAADAVVGDFIAFLQQEGIYDKAMIILLSDHGEGLGDHGEGEHGVLLYREAIHVPLIVKLPGGDRAGSTVDHDVQLIDVAATIAEVAGVPFTSSGISLLAPRGASRSVYGETLYPRLHFGWSELRSLVDGSLHYIEAPSAELYDISADSGETKNLAPERRRELARLKEGLSSHPRVDARPGAIDPEEAKKLAALGYVGSGSRESGPLANPRDRIAEIELLRKAIAYEAEATPEELVRFYRAAVERNPDSIDLRGHLGAALERVGRDEDAERQYKEALKRRPLVFEDIALSLASLQLRMSKLEEAEAHATLALGGQRARASQLLARVAIARRDFADAERLLGDPGADPSLRSFVVLAQIRANEGRVADAIVLLENARAQASLKGIDVELMHYALGDLYLASHKLPAAEAAFRDEIRAFPRNLQAWARLSLTLAAAGKRDEAVQLLRDMVLANPGPRADALADAAMKEMRSRY